jgi:hypothetical protein
LLTAATLPEAITLKEVGISVLHQRWAVALTGKPTVSLSVGGYKP